MLTVDPLISVLMPVYNGMPYLPLAVQSILKQTFTDFEFIIVNDCSTDNSLQYLEVIKNTDNRIRIVKNEKNIGLTQSLNKGLEIASGKYIARLDQDDIAYPDRFEIQVAHLEKNLDIGLLGSCCDIIDENGIVKNSKMKELNDLRIRWKMLSKNPFVHSTIMFRKQIIREYALKYESKFGEDYNLWGKMVNCSKARIIPEKLIAYRFHANNFTHKNNHFQVEALKTFSYTNFNQYIGFMSLNDWSTFQPVLKGNLTAKTIGESTFRDNYLILLKRFNQANYVSRNDVFFSERMKQLRSRIRWYRFYSMKTLYFWLTV